MRALLLVFAAGALGLGVYLRVVPTQPDASRHIEHWIGRLDTDGDRTLSRVEYVLVSDGLIAFDMVDLSADGQIDSRELEIFMRNIYPMWTFAEPD